MGKDNITFHSQIWPAELLAYNGRGGRGGTAIAGFQMSADAGQTVGPVVAGSLSDRYSYTTAFLASAGVSAVALVAALLMPETRRKTPPPEPPAGSEDEAEA